MPIIYIIEDNGCYGLTKGQFSATADVGSKLKSGIANEIPPIDTCSLAIELGATFVARSFSGDKKQLQAIMKAAIGHGGTVMIDVISPCVTFNDHKGSTKSYNYVREHRHDLQTIDFVPFFDEIQVQEEFAAGTSREVTLHDGSHLMLRKLEEDYDPTNRMLAMQKLEEHASQGEVLTGVFYVDTQKPNFMEALDLHETPLAHMNEKFLRPPESVLDEIMEELR